MTFTHRGRCSLALLAGLGLILASGCTSSLDLAGCREAFATLPIDSHVARQKVPANLQPRIDPQGKATLLMMVQDCARARLDGFLPIEPMRMVHLWIEIVGPAEVGLALEGTEASLPTQYYFALPHQIDDGLAHAALGGAGISVKAVKQIELGALSDGTRRGEVIEGDDGAKYRWSETVQVWPKAIVLTGRRRFYSRYGTLFPRSSEGVVVCNSKFLGGGRIDLEADASSTLGELARASSLSGESNQVEMSCRARMRVRFFEHVTADPFAQDSALAEPSPR